MILNPTSIPPLPKPRVRLRCRDIPPPKRNFSISFSLASKNNTTTTTTTNQIRTQLDQLHAEADQTRTKANSARSRLMRLTEAAENLRRRAAVEVGVGREDDARELLLQKKKVMQALEKSKKRVELLDDLSAKLIEAISVKETQLIGNVSLDLEISKEDTSHPIRIVSPKEDIAEHSKEAEVFEPDGIKSCQGHELEFQEDFQENVYADYLQKNGEGAASDVTFSGNKRIHLLNGISSYEDFLESLDQQFQDIEVELLTIFRLSTLVMESDEKQKSPKVRHTAEILKDVRGIRARSSILLFPNPINCSMERLTQTGGSSSSSTSFSSIKIFMVSGLITVALLYCHLKT
ncbi:hypothetical protein CKAN_01807600 [Cinnamomum micranthum f. kanehirae]|uniref:Uncharacterized protein n=1 Tax=Cinnamomum micranthum f. kanehirae TaxID=337451 RepID=A0A3S3QQU6_9MAGN|nr:hypothetical protein CKAN_01807600 [Cinnamomum micranthum f. kanehirae]